MNRVKLAIAIYTVIGFILMLIGVSLLYGMYAGRLVLRGIEGYIVIVGSLFVLFLGVHWVVVGIASLRSE